MIQFLSWLCMPIFIDYERIHRKSKGIKGYIESIKFYHYSFMSAVNDYGLIKAIRLYTIDRYK